MPPSLPGNADVLPGGPLERLYEGPDMVRWRMPDVIEAAYDGALGFDAPCVYANFVASLDGVVALGPEYPDSGSAISGHEAADRFVMGLLRALADVVVIGAGTLRAAPGHRWTPSHVWPRLEGEFAKLRRHLGRNPEPELVVVTARGDLPNGHPALEAGALVATTSAGARHLHDRLPASSGVMVVGDGAFLAIDDVLAAIHSRGHKLVLTEGGPSLLGQLVRDSLLDELFLTVSPLLAGRAGIPGPDSSQGWNCCRDGQNQPNYSACAVTARTCSFAIACKQPATAMLRQGDRHDIQRAGC